MRSCSVSARLPVTRCSSSAEDAPMTGISWLWNVFQGVPRPTANGIVGDPRFMNPGTGGDTIYSVDGYKLRATSPALNNGSVITSNGGRDYWANPVSATTKPHRGAYNGPGL